MENLGLALKISGVGIVVLLLVLTVFAGLISLLTKFLKDKPEEEQEAGEEENSKLKPNLHQRKPIWGAWQSWL